MEDLNASLVSYEEIDYTMKKIRSSSTKPMLVK